VVSVYLALAYRYARDHAWTVPKGAHFWSLMGDSEFREGSLLECLPDVAERQLGNVTWIVDYNRQNLDGTRIPNERSLHGADCDRIERTALANGWRVVQLRHGSFREELFKREGGQALRELFEQAFTDYEYQMLLLKRDAAPIRARAKAHGAQAFAALSKLGDADVVRAFGDLGGHDLARLVQAFDFAKQASDQPCMIIAHTVKGWNLECAADPSNHSALPDQKEQEAILARAGLSFEDPFALFEPQSREGKFLAQRRDLFRAAIEEHDRLRAKNRQWVKDAVARDGDLPASLEIDLSLFPLAHTQWMWGQLAAKLVRIGTADEGGPHTGSTELSATESRWKTAADFVLTLSPDVGTSTNISGAMDSRIYGPDGGKPLEAELQLKVRHPQLLSHAEQWTRHIRFEIAEANCMSAAGAFGKLGHYTGLPFMPIMTVYDFFVKRALDQLYYNLYWGSEFIVLGTPSGTTLSSEGAQHSWKSDIQMPNLITWEPLFAVEMDWILSDALRRQMEDDNEGRRGVLVRAVTRAITQRTLLELVRKHASSAEQSDEQLLSKIRDDCLAGAYYLIDWRGYEGYEPGDNVVNVFTMGSVATEAIAAAELLQQRGVFANVIHVSSPELLLGILGERSGYQHLCDTLGINGDLHATLGAGESEAGLVSLAGRRIPVVATCDGEAGLLDNIGSIVGVKQKTLAVRKFSKCGRPDEVYAYHHLDAESIVEACGEVLARTALENLRVSPQMLERFTGRVASEGEAANWRELWPAPDESAH
ncbi:MAG: pyruvate dehydrogenase, partial [Planctomycetota bacterium]